MRSNKHKQREQGFVLITVLLVVVLLTGLFLRCYGLSRQSCAAADSFGGRTQALQYAQAGLAIAQASLQADATDPEYDVVEAMLVSERRYEFDEGYCSVSIRLENGKCNVNRLKNDDDSLNRFRVDQMLRLIDLMNAQRRKTSVISYGIVPAIIDWVDSDDCITLLPFVSGDNAGAETNDYMIRASGKCRNRPMETVDDLLGVRGITSEILYGTEQENSKTGMSGLADHVTVFGDGAIDINHADKMVIQSFDEQIDSALADQIVAYRKLRPFEEIGELKDVPGMTAAIFSRISGAITTMPDEPVYRVTCCGSSGVHQKTITALLQKSKGQNDIEIIWYTE